MPDPDEVRQVVVHPAMWPHLKQWIEERGLALNLMCAATDEDLATYTVSPRNLNTKETRDRPRP